MPKDTASFSDGTLSATAQKELQGFATRVGKLMDERAEINEGITSIMKEAKDCGFDTKILRKAIKKVRTDPAERQAEEDMIDMYAAALGDLPLFKAAA